MHLDGNHVDIVDKDVEDARGGDHSLHTFFLDSYFVEEFLPVSQVLVGGLDQSQRFSVVVHGASALAILDVDSYILSTKLTSIHFLEYDWVGLLHHLLY